MIDTHAHLDFDSYDEDRDEVIENFFNENGKAIVNIGVNRERIQKTLEISKTHENIFASVGFHPEEIHNLDDFNNVEKYLNQVIQENQKIVAIGEIGLDYFHSKKEEEHQKQKELFEIQLKLAGELDLPAVLHCRDAYGDMLEIISKTEFKKTKKVLHCYSGSSEETKKFLGLEKLFFSFTGNITFPKKESPLWESIKIIPFEKIMAETDCPFLSPHPHRGERNEPVYAKFIIEKIAEIKKISFQEAEKQTDQSAVEFFGLNIY